VGGIVVWGLTKDASLSKENRIRYGIYYNVLLVVIVSFILGYMNLLGLIILLSVFAGIGSFIIVKRS
jgi:hypothetical protein